MTDDRSDAVEEFKADTETKPESEFTIEFLTKAKPKQWGEVDPFAGVAASQDVGEYDDDDDYEDIQIGEPQLSVESGASESNRRLETQEAEARADVNILNPAPAEGPVHTQDFSLEHLQAAIALESPVEGVSEAEKVEEPAEAFYSGSQEIEESEPSSAVYNLDADEPTDFESPIATDSFSLDALHSVNEGSLAPVDEEVEELFSSEPAALADESELAEEFADVSTAVANKELTHQLLSALQTKPEEFSDSSTAVASSELTRELLSSMEGQEPSVNFSAKPKGALPDLQADGATPLELTPSGEFFEPNPSLAQELLGQLEVIKEEKSQVSRLESIGGNAGESVPSEESTLPPKLELDFQRPPEQALDLEQSPSLELQQSPILDLEQAPEVASAFGQEQKGKPGTVRVVDLGLQSIADIGRAGGAAPISISASGEISGDEDLGIEYEVLEPVEDALQGGELLEYTGDDIPEEPTGERVLGLEQTEALHSDDFAAEEFGESKTGLEDEFVGEKTGVGDGVFEEIPTGGGQPGAGFGPAVVERINQLQTTRADMKSLVSKMVTAMQSAATSTGEELLEQRVSFLLDHAKSLLEKKEAAGAISAVLLAEAVAEAKPSLLDGHQQFIRRVVYAYIGTSDSVVDLVIPLNELSNHNIAAIEAFILSRVDGMMNMEELISVSGLSSSQAFLIFCRLHLRKLISFR